MTGEADLSDAVLLDEPALDDLQGALEFAFGLIDVAGDDQHARDAGFANQPGQKVVENRGALGSPCDHVRHGVHAFTPQPPGQGDGVLARHARHVRDVHRRSRRHQIRISLEARGFANRCLN
jgi:hypothetical protein